MLGLMIGVLGSALAGDGSVVHGMTISTPTYGIDWGSESMVRTLETLNKEGVNWIAIHPYAGIQKNGHVRTHLDPDNPPRWITRPIEEAHARGQRVLIKPHLAHWGSGFSWRGAIAFEDPDAEARFFKEYQQWIIALAKVTSQADAFCVGTELDKTVHNQAAWRQIIARIRQVHPGHLTYAANWDQYANVPFWDALDTVGIQAYFPISQRPDPSDAELDAGWQEITAQLRDFSTTVGKPIVFTELGYDASPDAAAKPWRSGRGAFALQERALERALVAVDAEPSIVGAFLWKWFPGELAQGDFRMSRTKLRQVIRNQWAYGESIR